MVLGAEMETSRKQETFGKERQTFSDFALVVQSDQGSRGLDGARCVPYCRTGPPRWRATRSTERVPHSGYAGNLESVTVTKPAFCTGGCPGRGCGAVLEKEKSSLHCTRMFDLISRLACLARVLCPGCCAMHNPGHGDDATDEHVMPHHVKQTMPDRLRERVQGNFGCRRQNLLSLIRESHVSRILLSN